ncbi:uncharacterized protein LOC111861362 isoform X4 [Cryptotermes secundus]|uniref:uncharacterized protein LOC111861362 isoform X4 n=1 Tax=Cryptotermes secundus TaxID=105785 RepID=UPI000CD7CC62|nr:uncharacterized protein LOC111861362 isoform X4 [Cryptotermes secundus]
MAPGINGRQTGTVPKTKAHNDASRDIVQIQREQSFNNIPNNLVTLDWQPSSDMGHTRTRKTSNTQSALLDYYDLGPEGSSVHDNGRFASPHYSHAEEQQMAWGVINRCSQEVNGHSEGSASTSSSSRRSRTPRNVLSDHRRKSNNITKMPDRNQVVCRLNQIRDYIKQTSSLMDTLKNSGDPRHIAQYHKLAKMVSELRESEGRLQEFLPSLEKDLEPKTQENKSGTAVAECGSEVGSSMTDLPSIGVNSHTSPVPPGGGRRAADGSTGGRSRSEELGGAVLKSSDSARRNELKMKVEESQRTLQVLQEHQAALLVLQEKAQEQLKEARAAQLVQMLGEGDEELVSEQLVLHDKLQELQYKKQHMDHLVAEFQTINNLPAVATGSQADVGSSKDGSDGEAECSDGEADSEIVRDKIAELNRMKAQLARLKGIMSAVQNIESSDGTIQNGIDQEPGSREDGEDLEAEEQAVNLRRQKRDKSRGGSVRSVARSNSNTSASGSSKPDNIVQAGSEVDRARDIQHKTAQLQEAKARLQQLQDLMAAVTDFHNRGQPVPDQYIDLLSQEVAREEEQGVAGRAEIAPTTVSRMQRRSVERERTPVKQQVLDSGLPDGCEVTLEVVQAMTRDLRQQTRSLQEERERLVSAQRELGKLQQVLPLREKKTNTQVDAQTHQQLLLHAELQAKRRELEELMRKDQGQTSAINQDVCSEVSADKSDAPAYSFLAEGTTNATWGGSTHGTLDDLAEQDNDIQEQSAGYSSDEGQDGDEEEICALHASPSQQLRQAQLNNSNNNNKDPLSQTTTTTRELLSMSVESGRLSLSGNINTDNSNAASVAGSSGRVPLPAGGCAHAQRQGPASHNVWRKASTDSGMSVPRAVWTPLSQQARQENLCAAEELVSSSNNLDTNNSSSSATLHNTGLVGSNTSPSWWQHRALQLQHQLEVTSNLCQSMLVEQAQQQQHGNNLQPYWGFPPPPYPTTPHPQAHSITAGGLGGHLLPTSVASDVYYQQLLAASQLQQQQMLLTTVTQCCQLLWLQQREMVALRSAVQALQEKASHGNGSRGAEGYSSPVMIGQSEEAVLVTSNQNSARPTPHQSQSNLTRLQQPTTGPTMTSFTPYQNLKPSYSGGLFQSPEEMTASSGVTSAHSLPNLSQTTSANSVFSPHHADAVPSNAPLNNAAVPSNAPLNNIVPNFGLSLAPNSPVAGSLALSFPMNNNANFNNRSQQQTLSSLIQCCAPQPGSCAPWLQQGATGGTPGLLQGQTNPSPVPALNNQVPPGNRANNYWDNFRSYSRQNLLSTSTKSNEGVSHSPSPLVDRSHNTLRSSFTHSSSITTVDPQPSTVVLSQGIGAIFSSPEQNMSRKEKLNTEQYQSSQDSIGLPQPAHSKVSDTTGLQYQLLGAPSACSCCPRLREPPQCSGIQPQQNIATPKTQRQILVNENVPQDLRLQANVLGISDLVGCSSTEGGGHSFSCVSGLHLDSDTAVDVRNMALAGQAVQSHQNLASTSEPLSSYRCTQESREELSEFSLIKSEAVSVPAVIKKKNPKILLSSASESQQKCAPTCDSTANMTDAKPQHVGNALFEALSESVYSEVAALISSNENRPHFLIQLFRDLQMISSDPLRQRTLQSIQEVVSQYLANTLVNGHHQPPTDSQQLGENENFPVQDEHIMDENAVSCDEQISKDEGGRYHLAESLPSSLMGPGSEAHCLPNLVARHESCSGPPSIAESEEGAAALLPSAHSSPRALPKNAAWNIKDGLSLPTELPGRSSKLDWEVQAVLVELLPFLNTHLDETCSSSLLEAVRRLTLQLVRAQNLSLIASTAQHSSQPSRLGCCYQGQLDALLEDALLKFQGCRLRDISEELLTVVAEVLLSELTFLRLVDTVSRGDSNNESNQECCRNPAMRDHDPEECTESSGTMHQPAEATQQFFTSEVGSRGYHDSRDAGLSTKAYNGDLAEADQSHHEESADAGIPELEAESAAAMSVAEEVSSEGQSTQAEGVATPDSCIMNNTTNATENQIQAEAMVTASDDTGDFITTEVEEEWEVEQDREQGLDQVPTRLSTDQPRAASCSGSSIPERDGHSLVPHPANQPDAPNP